MIMRNTALLLVAALGLTVNSEKKTHILDFPNPRQSYEYSCGPGAVQAVLAYYGRDFRESQLIDLLRTDKDDGTLIRDIVKFLNSQGLSTDIKEHMTINQLFGYLDRNIPVIVLIQAWGKPADFENHYKNNWNDGHFVVVIGYDYKNVICSDPALFKAGYIPFREFMDRWHDYDEGETRTYNLGIAVYGKKPKFASDEFERIK